MNEPVRHSIRVACPVEHAFTTFTARIDVWWPRSHRKIVTSRITLQPGAGGRLFERTDDGTEHDLGQVVLWEPPHRLAYTWRPGAPPGFATDVDVRFTADGDGTRVDVVHSEGQSGLGDQWPTRALRFRASWETVLAAFGDAIVRPPSVVRGIT